MKTKRGKCNHPGATALLAQPPHTMVGKCRDCKQRVYGCRPFWLADGQPVHGGNKWGSCPRTEGR